METIGLKTIARKEGKSSARGARKNGMIPSVLYGKDHKPAPISVNAEEFEEAVSTHSGMNVLLKLALGDGGSVVARVRDYQAHPISRVFTHVDFQVVDLAKKIVVEVPIHLDGKAKGVKEGGVLVTDRRTLVVKCLPTAIPERIVIDINDLAIGDSIHIDDLKLAEGVECPHDVNFSIVSVVTPMKEEVAAPVAEVAPVEGAAAAAPAGGAAAPGAVPAAGAVPPPGGAKPAAGVAGAVGAKPAGTVPAAGAPVKEKK